MKGLKKAGNKKIYVIMFLIVIFVFLFLYKFCGINVKPYIGNASEYLTTVNEVQSEKVIDLKEGDVVTQTLRGIRDEIIAFNVRFGTHQQTINGKVKVKFIDNQDKKILKEENLDCKKIVDNQYHLFVLDQVITNARDKDYTISVELISVDENNKLALFASEKDMYEDGMCTYNGQKMKNMDISCQLSGTSGFMHTWYWLASAIILMGLVCFIFVTFIKKSKIEYVYLVLALTFGMVYILCFPPYTAPDEGVHMSTTYAFANEFLGQEGVSETTGQAIFRKTDGDLAGGTQVSPQKFQSVYQAFKYPSNNFEETYEWGRKLDVPFTSYLPQVFGVLLGLIFKLNGFMTMYLGKICAMLFFIGCVFFSIKMIPWGKMVIMILGLLPMTLELSTSFSYDCALNGLCIVFISYTCYLISKKKSVTWKDFLFLGVIISIIAPCKMFYFLIAGMLFLIPKEKYASKKMYWIMNTSILLLGFVVLVAMRFKFLASFVGTESASAIAPTTSNYTISKILGNIPLSINVLFNTVVGKSDFYFSSLWGESLGWFQVSIPGYVITGFVLIMFVASVCTNREEQLIFMPNVRFRIINLSFSIIMILGILAALWLGWTPDTFQVIEGVQGRYFLPFLPMILFSFKNRIFTLQKNIDRGLASILFFLLFLTFIYIVPYAILK